jgi:hypothetical protein
MEIESSSHDEIKELLAENKRLLLENNNLLHKMRRASLISGILRLVWFLILAGGFTYAYLEYIKPNIKSLQAGLEELKAMTSSTDSLKEWYEGLKSPQ